MSAPADFTPEAKTAWEKSSDFANYFCTYGFIYHQKQMLTDHLRMQRYREAIFENIDSFKDKVVLDVGTGSGILSIWAAQAGARKVYAVEATDMAVQARAVIAANKQDHIITVIQSKVEDIQLPEQVDIIISEWMGYFLLRESMFDSVIVARDRWLKPGGALYPSHAQMYIAPLGLEQTALKRFSEFSSAMDDWTMFVSETKEQWGVDYSCLGNAFRKEQELYSLYTSQWLELNPSDVIGEEVTIKSLDLNKCTIEDVASVFSEFSFTIGSTTRFGAIGGWFDVDFKGSKENPAHTPVTLTTSPFVEPTHWGQQAFALCPPTQVCAGDVIRGTIAVVRRNDNQRLMNVKFDYAIEHVGDNRKPALQSIVFQVE
ncbi:hypothetical protein SPRG_02297 [Saprolegnia parasitica CBS 223.65]|uniref:Protein arginine N-methyltransferase domain-containing protein n=1 Tax=Saprolegnia parasitica (strain CBS 223.65) TaxID=695850 RepID=A0A067CRZ8_SAPPC|nr:hypothetical protein SPRG_02297 [Saprolegnia parasitica CBS 223.65]KDO33489.1 hypothetical protein SPRG_02297 [Saprolegnia parasitica CBS 223.65]|eukprot:XP_012196233.1 hypothetical protein SPRG_02297 [Saprolegnia parasitica CBS 223.65]